MARHLWLAKFSFFSDKPFLSASSENREATYNVDFFGGLEFVRETVNRPFSDYDCMMLL
jgi:hypothetical protein